MILINEFQLDLIVIDNFLVNGSGRRMIKISNIFRHLQTGYLYHYVFVMIICILTFLVWMVFF